MFVIMYSLKWSSMNSQDINPDEQIEVKKPFFKNVHNQRLIVLAILVVSFVGIFTVTQGDKLIQLSNEENDMAIKMEEVGFSYAYGTEPTDLGNEIDGFEAANEEQLSQLVEAVDNSEEFIDDEGQDLFELLEYDEWNNEGLIEKTVVEQLISAAGSEN
jgi:hypothetical protein